MNTKNNYKYRPITKADYKKINHKCFADNTKVDRLFEKQDVLGIGVWQNDISVGTLHFYQLDTNNKDDSLFPDYGINDPHNFPLGLPARALYDGLTGLEGKVLGLSCYHVGLQLENDDNDMMYYSKGIGTRLCSEAISWAVSQGYVGIITHGGPANLFDYTIGFGALPYTTYKKLNFVSVFEFNIEGTLPDWFNNLPIGYKDRFSQMLSKGAETKDILNQVMVYKI